MVNCPNCSAEIKDLTQNFCEKCGSSIPANVKQGETTSTSAEIAFTPKSDRESYDRSGGLFDISRNYYILWRN